MSNWLEIRENFNLKKVYKQKIAINRLIRQFFWNNGFDEVQTPIAIKLPSQEPYLNPVKILFKNPLKEKFKFYLQTSPEFSMKKLLASGFKDIFQICQCFRNQESFGELHNPEFSMLEWYRSSGSLKNIMDDTERLFKYIGKKLNIKFLNYKKNKVLIFQKWEKITMKELWKKYINVNLDNYLDVDSLSKLNKKFGYQVSVDDRYEDLFFKIFLNKIEPNLGNKTPIFVYNYPSQMCSLSKYCKDKRYAERFELYISGIEVANAFGELTDGKEQKIRLNKDKKIRQKLKKEVWDIDLDFINAIDKLPKKSKETMSGVALGIDRMVLLFTEVDDLNKVIFQSVKDQI